MLSLRQWSKEINKTPPIDILHDISLQCKSLRDSFIAAYHTSYELLIITPQEFLDAVKPLSDHKFDVGITNLVITLEHIYEVFTGRDEAEKVKRCLYLFAKNNNVKYVMLIGDADKFPVRYVKWWGVEQDHPNDPEYHTLYVPSDLYDAALYKKSDQYDMHKFDDWGRK